MAREGISLDPNSKNRCAEAPGPHHFVKILDGDMKADHRLLEWMATAYPQTSNLKK